MDHRVVMSLVNRHVNRTLTIAQAALPEGQYPAFRKLMLDEFGREGLEKEVADLFRESTGLERKGMGRK